RRRHTRCLSDWSSDVCSSDLGSTNLASQEGTFSTPVSLYASAVFDPHCRVELVEPLPAPGTGAAVSQAEHPAWPTKIKGGAGPADRKSTRLNSSHLGISYAVF